MTDLTELVDDRRSLFLDAIDVLAARGWHQGDLYGPDNSCCIEGALREAVAGANRAAYEVVSGLETLRRIVGRGPIAFNDDPHTTYDDVIDALQRAHEASL